MRKEVTPFRDLKTYHNVINEVWMFFKKHYNNFDAVQAIKDIDTFEQQIKKEGPRLYDFGMRMIKMAWREAGEINELRR